MTSTALQSTGRSIPTLEIEIWRVALWEEIGYAPHPGQVRLHLTSQEYQFVEAEMGRQWGKSTSAARGFAFPEWIRWRDTLTGWDYQECWPRNVLLVAPFLDQADIIFTQVHEIAHRRGIPLERDRSSGKLDLMTPEGSRLRCMSGQNPAAMRGPQWDIVIIDEGSYVKNLRRMVEEVLMPTLIRRRGKLIIMGSPDAPGSDTHRFALMGDDPGVPEWGHVRGPSSDNWYIPGWEDWIESQRRQGVPEDVILREYFAEFRPRRGLVYPEGASCVMGAEELRAMTPLLNEFGTWCRAIDWGFVNPCVVIVHARVGEMLFAWDELYVTMMTPDRVAAMLASQDGHYDFELNVADLERPDNIAFMAAYRHHGAKGAVPIKGSWVRKGTKPTVLDRIENLRTMMGMGLYRIHPRCRNYIRELGMERYPDSNEMLNVSEKPIDAHNHGSSASGYLAWFLFGRRRGPGGPGARPGEQRGKALAGYAA